MAWSFEAEPTPATSPLITIDISKQQVALIRPARWPSIGSDGLCTVPDTVGWKGLLLDRSTTVPTLTQLDDSAQATEEYLKITVSDVKAMDPGKKGATPSQSMGAQDLSQASQIEAHYYDLAPNVAATNRLPADVIQALAKLPTNHPTILYARTPSGSAGPMAVVGSNMLFDTLPGFALNVNPAQEVRSLQLDSSGLQTEVPQHAYNVPRRLTYTVGKFAVPSLRFPLVDKPIALSPMTGVWYPASKQLIVVTWTDRTADIQSMLK